MQFKFMKQVKIQSLTDNTGMTGIMHEDIGDGFINVLLVHGPGSHPGVLVSVVPIKMPADSLEEIDAEKTA